MTAAIMSAVPSRRAGAGSAMNDATRELGAALGVAVLGSIAASQYSQPSPRRAQDPSALGPRHAAASSIAGALHAAAQLPGRRRGASTSRASTAFVDGIHVAALFGVVLAIIAAVLTTRFLPRRSRRGRDALPVDALENTAELGLGGVPRCSPTNPPTIPTTAPVPVAEPAGGELSGRPSGTIRLRSGRDHGRRLRCTAGPTSRDRGSSSASTSTARWSSAIRPARSRPPSPASSSTAATSSASRPTGRVRASSRSVRGHGIEPHFVGGKHHLHEVREQFPADRYLHVGDTDVDERYALLAGFEFLHVTDLPVPVVADSIHDEGI